MRYLAIAVLSALGGFVAAWWMRSPLPAEPPAQLRAPVEQGVFSRRSTTIPDSPRVPSRPLEFEDIETGATVFDQLYIATQLAAEADPERLELLLDGAIGHADPLYVFNIVPLLLERYTALDPDGAIAYVNSDRRLDQTQMQGHVLTSWIRNDPEGALAYFRGMAEGQIKTAIGARLLSDPTLADSGILDEIEEIIGPQAEQIREQIEMSRADPVQLFESALASTDPQRGRQLQYALQRWVRQDPEAALARIGTISSEATRSNLVRMALIQYAQQDAEAALYYLQVNDPRNSALEAQILESMARQNIDRALPLVEEFVRRTGNDNTLSSMLSIWAYRDPDSALAYLRTIDLEPHSLQLYLQFASSFGVSNPTAALDWALGLDDEFAKVLQRSVVHAAAIRETSNVEQALARTTDEETRAIILESIASARARSDPLGALEWLATYRREPGYIAGYNAVLQQLAHNQPASAAQMFDQSLPSNQLRSLAQTIASAWARGDPDAAQRWVKQLRDDEVRDSGVAGLVTAIAPRDPDEALEIARDMAPGVTRDQVMRSIASVMIGMEPDRFDEIVASLELSDAVIESLRSSHSSRQPTILRR